MEDIMVRVGSGILVAAIIGFAGPAYAQDDVCVIFGICEDPVVEEPPVVDDPVVDDPVAEEPPAEDPVVEEPPVAASPCPVLLVLPANASAEGKARSADGIARANEVRCAQ
jgi:hypothetical protein